MYIYDRVRVFHSALSANWLARMMRCDLLQILVASMSRKN